MSTVVRDRELVAEAASAELDAAVRTLRSRSAVLVRLVRPGVVHVAVGRHDLTVGAADAPWMRAALALLGRK